MTTTTAANLRTAARIIREGGHTKGLLVDGPRHCVMGAIIFARTGEELEPYGSLRYQREHYKAPEAEALSKFLGLNFSWSWGNTLAAWNNADERTEVEVNDALLGAADALDKELVTV